MGDGGSLVIGWLLAIATIRTTFVDTADPNYALGNRVVRARSCRLFVMGGSRSTTSPAWW